MRTVYFLSNIYKPINSDRWVCSPKGLLGYAGFFFLLKVLSYEAEHFGDCAVMDKGYSRLKYYTMAGLASLLYTRCLALKL